MNNLVDLLLDCWFQFSIEMGDGWTGDGGLSTLEAVARELVRQGRLAEHPSKRWYRVPPNAKVDRADAGAEVVSDHCTWVHHNAQICAVSCRNGQYWHYTLDCKFCPFCGKPIAAHWPSLESTTGVTATQASASPSP